MKESHDFHGKNFDNLDYAKETNTLNLFKITMHICEGLQFQFNNFT